MHQSSLDQLCSAVSRLHGGRNHWDFCRYRGQLECINLNGSRVPRHLATNFSEYVYKEIMERNEHLDL